MLRATYVGQYAPIDAGERNRTPPGASVGALARESPVGRRASGDGQTPPR